MVIELINLTKDSNKQSADAALLEEVIIEVNIFTKVTALKQILKLIQKSDQLIFLQRDKIILNLLK